MSTTAAQAGCEALSGLPVTVPGVWTEEVTLVDPAQAKPKYVRLAADGTRLVRETWTGPGGKPRMTEKTFAPESGLPADHVASMELRSEAVRRMRAGYVLIRDQAESGPGDVVLLCAAPNRAASGVFDLSPDGHTLAVGTTLAGGVGAEIHLIDVRTGLRRRVHAVANDPDPASYDYTTFIHQVLFDADGQGIVYAVNGQTGHLDLNTGATRSLAHFTYVRGVEIFYSQWVKPSWDAARQRLLVFDADSRIRVLDRTGDPVLDLPVRDASTCRGGALSRSGRLLVLRYGHADIEVWEVDTGSLVRRMDFPFPPDEQSDLGARQVGFDVSEGLVLVDRDIVAGPFAASIETGELAWSVTNQDGPTWTWSFSPDGTVLALGGVDHISLYRATDLERMPAQPPRAPLKQLGRVAFSADGSLVAGGGDGGQLGVFTVPAHACAPAPDRHYTEVSPAAPMDAR